MYESVCLFALPFARAVPSLIGTISSELRQTGDLRYSDCGQGCFRAEGWEVFHDDKRLELHLSLSVRVGR